MFDAAYWRAKEGELARTITGSMNVRSARVHLANPTSDPFARNTAGSASVTVTMARGELTRAQAEAIRYLVSSAVVGVPLDGVAVIDAAKGVVLAGAESPFDALTGSPEDRAATLKGNIQRLLEARVGHGRAIVEVNIDTAMDSETVTERTIDPDSRVAISTDVEETSDSSSGTSPSVTVASNLPDGDTSGQSGNSSRNATTSRERQNFEVSETRRERVIQPGQVRRISVAVMVDGVSGVDDKGKPTWEPRSDTELGLLQQLVQSAIGYDSGRGDVVTIQSLQFTIPPEEGALAEGGNGFLDVYGVRIIQLGVLATVVLALIFFVLRPIASRRQVLDISELTGIPSGPPRLAGPEQPGGDILDLPAQKANKIDRLREVISSRTEDLAAVLRSWIETPERKEPASS